MCTLPQGLSKRAFGANLLAVSVHDGEQYGLYQTYSYILEQNMQDLEPQITSSPSLDGLWAQKVYDVAAAKKAARRLRSLPSREISRVSRGSTVSVGQPATAASSPIIKNFVQLEVEKHFSSTASYLITESRWFNTLMTAFVALNAIYLGIETDYAGPDGSQDQVWFVIEVLFSCVFCGEILLRLYSGRTRFFRDRWNLFDFVLVAVTCIDTFVLGIIMRTKEGAVELMGGVRMLRLARVARIIRILRFTRNLWLLVAGIFGAMRALLWAWVLLVMIVFVFGILMTRYVGKPNDQLEETMAEWFGTVPKSMFTLFQILTLEGWPIIARRMMNINPWGLLLIIVFMMSTTFSVMNVIVGVIVECTLDQSTRNRVDNLKMKETELRDAERKILDVFHLADVDKDGLISRDDFLHAIKNKEVMKYLRDIGIDERQAENIFDIIDFDDIGSIAKDEFLSGLTSARGNAHGKDILAVQSSVWKRQHNIHREITQVVDLVSRRMQWVDSQIELLHLDLCSISRFLGVPLRTPHAQSDDQNPSTAEPSEGPRRQQSTSTAKTSPAPSAAPSEQNPWNCFAGAEIQRNESAALLPGATYDQFFEN